MATAPVAIRDVVPDSVLELALDTEFLNNGNFVPVVDGQILPGVTDVRFKPANQEYAQVQTDARREPDAFLKYFSEGSMIELECTTQQAPVITALLRQGTTYRAQAATNTARQVGTPGSLPTTPSGTTGAEWKLMKTTSPIGLTTALFNWDEISKVDMTPAAAAWKMCLYVPNATPPATFVAATDVIDLDTITTLTDAYKGTFTIQFSVGVPVPAGAPYTYDPNQVYYVQTATEKLVVDSRQANLIAGDPVAIFGLTYKYAQLENASDYSYSTPYGERQRSRIELYRCLGEAPEGYKFERHTFFNCEQWNIPDLVGSGTGREAAKKMFQFRVKQQTGRLKDSRYQETSYIVVPRT